MDKQPRSEQLEEGEIIDDDVFEDISDNSIIEPTFGKLASSNENLRALSLSSGSEKELFKNAKLKRKLLHRKPRIKQQRRRKKRRLSIDSSETDSQCEDLKDKLKEAIHISGIENSCKNTLETRLKAMGGLGSIPIPAAESPPPQDNDNLDNSDKIDDNEIENLRIEALRTAVLNKFKRRKRKKTENQTADEKAVGAQENKENDTPKMEPVVEPTPVNNSDKKQVNNAIDLEEDEDVLRASLLAGLAKKITKVQQPAEVVINAKPEPPKLPPVLPKKTLNNLKISVNKIVQSRPKPQVKPLIINLNADSDSDTEEIQKKSLNDVPKIANLKTIATNVEKFLKEQRVRFETDAKTKRLQLVKKKENKSILEKSAVKLLPKSQQIEYQQLLRKLKNAERQKRAKKIAQLKEPEQKPQINTDTLTVQIPLKESSENRQLESLPQSAKEDKVNLVNEARTSDSTEHDSKESDTERKKFGVTNELTLLQKSLKEIKLHRNGSLQIKRKYQVLTPIIKKITAASNERKKHELRIKNLSKELNEARINLARSHERFSALVRELVDKKETIDKSFESIKTTEKTKENGNNVNITKQTSASAHNFKSKKETAVPVTSTPIKPHLDRCSIEEAAISNIVSSTTANGYEDMDVCNSDETDIYQIDIVDPNDIDQIFKRRPVVKSTIPEYVSPLNLNSYERYRHVDPLGIMCPYEVNGSCRDLDCTFKHYLKTHDRL